MDLVILDMTGLDIILAITWFPPYYVMLNSNTKLITLEISDRKILELEWAYKSLTSKVIYFMWVTKLVGLVDWGILLILRDVDVNSPSIGSILVVSKLKEVFHVICFV